MPRNVSVETVKAASLGRSDTRMSSSGVCKNDSVWLISLAPKLKLPSAAAECGETSHD